MVFDTIIAHLDTIITYIAVGGLAIMFVAIIGTAVYQLYKGFREVKDK